MTLDPETRYPVEQVLPNLVVEIDSLEDGEVADFALLVFEVEDEESGAYGWSYRTTEAPNREELLGALEILIHRLKTSDASCP